MQNSGYPIDQSPLFKLRSKARLARLLKMPTGELVRLAKDADTIYSEFDVAKKSGGTRHVENPARRLKLVQTKLSRILGRIRPPDYLFCPVKGRCYVSNAARHRGQRVVRCLDIRKYFPSTPSRRVFWFFRNVMQCESDVADLLAKIACLNGHLPTGSPLSPIMAYYAYFDVWEAIANICAKQGYILTVYVDDVTISGENLTAEALWEIKRAIHRSGLIYHKEKKYIGRKPEITGVIVDGDRLRAPNRQHKKMDLTRAAIRRSRSMLETKKLEEKLAGLNGQMSQIRKRGNGPKSSET